jgi:hypothetical protein
VKAYPSSVRPLPAAAWRRLRGCPFRCRACDSAGLPPHIESWCRCGARSAGKMSRSPGLTASAGLEPEPGSAPASRFASAAEISAGIWSAPRRHERPDRRPDLGPSCANWPPVACWCWRTRATPGSARASVPVQGQGKLTAQKAADRVSRPAARPRRTRQRPAQNLAHPAQTPLLPLEGRAARQGHPRTSDPRDRRMKNVQ